MSITSKMIEKFVGIKANTLHYYIKAGAIIPDVDPGSGTGSQRLFSPTNVMESAIIHRMMTFFLPKRMIIDVFKSINKSRRRKLLNPESILADKNTKFLMFYPSANGKIRYNIYSVSGVPSSTLEAFFVINLSHLASKYGQLKNGARKAELWDKILKT